MGFLKNYIKFKLMGNAKVLVWHNKFKYTISWVAQGQPSEKEDFFFNYYIYYYPYKMAGKYELDMDPLEIIPTNNSKIKLNPTNYTAYDEAIKKLMEFERNEPVKSRKSILDMKKINKVSNRFLNAYKVSLESELKDTSSSSTKRWLENEIEISELLLKTNKDE